MEPNDHQKDLPLSSTENRKRVVYSCNLLVALKLNDGSLRKFTYGRALMKYPGLLPDDMHRLKTLDDENFKLKTIVADPPLDRKQTHYQHSAGHQI